MKKKTSVIITSAAAIAVCASVMAGSTYALFTSESTTDIVVKSGTVDVKANVQNRVDYTALSVNEYVDQDVLEQNGEKVVITDENQAEYYLEKVSTAEKVDGNVNIEAMRPGDLVTLDVAVDNLSAVTAKYRTTFTAMENDLTKLLDITVDGNSFNGIARYSTSWQSLPAKTNGQTVPVSIYFPIEIKNFNDAEVIETTVSFKIEAVQGNAYIENEESSQIEVFPTATSLKIPDGVTELPENFLKNTSITSITLPASVKTIGGSKPAFTAQLIDLTYEGSLEEWFTIEMSSKDASALTSSKFKNLIVGDEKIVENGNYMGNGYQVKDGVESFNLSNTFYSCRIDKLTLPSTTTILTSDRKENKYIKDIVFNGTFEEWCEAEIQSDIKISSKLTVDGKEITGNLEIPEGITTINSKVFSMATSVSGLVLPASVKSISANAFNSYYIRTIDYKGSVENWCGIDFNDNSPWTSDAIFTLNGEKVSDLNLNVEKINSYAFYGFSNIKSVTIGNSVKEIGSSAFASSGIKTLVIEGAPVIGNRSFATCRDLSEIVWGQVERIEAEAFMSCTGLRDVVLPETLTYIGDGAFKSCSNSDYDSVAGVMLPAYGVTSFTISDSVKYIGASAFFGNELTIKNMSQFNVSENFWQGWVNAETGEAISEEYLTGSFGGNLNVVYDRNFKNIAIKRS